MRFIIDTHILIWFLEGDLALSTKRRQLVIDGNNNVLVSVASLWEIAIKVSLGKLSLAESIPTIIKKVRTEAIEILPVLPNHIVQVSTLPFHHKDPFDRMIIAQAMVESIQLMSADDAFSVYGVVLIQ